ncbi:inositol-3-phosphate synthase [Nocardiopsis sp. MG754419]|uniref:inositol-3-phosphate synthase n=1 Tax=Nocardiopsis sp. MG754419 TaxID=2259865 RepID=UPI001BA8E67D|nr:inositol-3-phosphate synthase [Nocardiopsis sp. MG754419]MBR8740970.1 myo-inositol-1-phosphate synthase [Nocardiopsis sp. MG754419]
MTRIGVWLVGARGSVATTAVLGAMAVRAGAAEPTGCVTERPEFAGAGLPGIGDLVFAGHDVHGTHLAKSAEPLARSGVLPPHLPEVFAEELGAVDRRIRRGLEARPEGFARHHADALEADLRAFAEAEDLERVVVVDVSSTEPPPPPSPELADPDLLEAALDAGTARVPASSVYAYAALRAGCSFVEFTPNAGPRAPAVAALAERLGLPWAGSDGKTGETLVKSALAPMFAARALRVRSWSATNLLGGGDGRTLADPESNSNKSASKARGLEALLGHPVDGPLHIDYVPDLGDAKTAWDHVSFEGFLGARMTLQFTWSGYDSALAAPLVLDLARLSAHAHRTGRVGAVPELGFFFKDPAASDVHGLAEQWRALTAWCGGEEGGRR